MQTNHAIYEWAILGLFAFSALSLVFYYLFIYLRLAIFKNKKPNLETPPVSVVVCAKNEEDNLMNFVPLLMEQDYPNYEVIIVNDFSEDGTIDILNAYDQKYPNLKVINIKHVDSYNIGKKYPLTVGIKGASNEHLIFTDADCYPKSKLWIKEIMQAYKPETEVVLAFGGHEKRKGFFNKLLRYDTFQVAFQYLSFALAGAPYMGVGRNMSYKKSLFFRNKGFAMHHHIISGDDDLFINRAANAKNVNVAVCKNSHTVSIPKETFHDWYRQKLRHTTTGKFYKFRDKFYLSYLYFTKLFFVLSSIAAGVLQLELPIVAGIFGFVFLLHFIIAGVAAKKLDSLDLLIWSPIFELYFLYFQPYIAIASLRHRKYLWK